LGGKRRGGGWKGGGGGGTGDWAAAPQFQNFLKFFGQSADDSGDRIREKTF